MENSEHNDNALYSQRSESSEPKPRRLKRNAPVADSGLEDFGGELSIEQLQAQIQALEEQIGDKPTKTKPKEDSSKKRDVKAAQKKHAEDDGIEIVSKKPEKKTGGKKKQMMTDDEIDKLSETLSAQMKTAVAADNQNNREKKAALNKLIALDEVSKNLKCGPIQEHFLDNGGCTLLGEWLDMLPDGSFPNVKIQKEILHCIEVLPIHPDNLQESRNLGRIIKTYASGKGVTPEVQAMAKNIMDRWSRMVFGINTGYEGESALAQRKYQHLRAEMNRIRKDESDESDTEIRKKSAFEDDDQVQPNQFELPLKNAFDFVERPKKRDIMNNSKLASAKGLDKFRKLNNHLKKSNRVGTFKSNLKVVKIDM